VAALLAEMEAAASPSTVADTLYVGGGTPTVMTTASLARIVEAARRLFALPEAAEVTVEANPADLAAGGYRALRDAGFDRVSVGVQSFDDGVLREMGRPHTASRFVVFKDGHEGDVREGVRDEYRALF
jgi:oxygen-independent coproporphyrinogen-3 oxidase